MTQTLTAEEITTYYGERCPDFEPECACCQMWAMYDGVKALQEENHRLRHIVSDCAAALNTGAFILPEATVDFMEGLPKEIALILMGLRSAKEGSDQP
ncbi:hypothetical protein EVC08_044 [Rhizobium phage RHph_N65]|nr:hypothetical protein EVC08_044 [Rhizobium phage RHph_N65]